MALPGHPIDSAIGTKKRDAVLILKDLAGSDEFLSVVKAAVEESEELKPGVMGASFAQKVRIHIAEQLLLKIPSAQR